MTRAGHLLYLREPRDYYIANYFVDSQGVKIKDDYWTIDKENNKAIRVHVRYRKELYLPSLKTTMPGSDKTSDPYIHLLGEQRTTTIYYKGKEGDPAIVLKDDKTTRQTLDDWWIGYTVFDLLEERAQTTTMKGTMLHDTKTDDEHLMADTTTNNERTKQEFAPPPGLENVMPTNVDC